MFVWQLKATLPSSQSSRKSASTSLDQSCPRTSIARHSLLCSYTSHPREVSLAKQELIEFRAFLDIRASTCLLIQETDYHLILFTFCCKKVKTNQRTRLERFRRDKGVGRHVARNYPRLLLDKEEKELAMRPILHLDVPISGWCVQRHTVPWVQERPDVQGETVAMRAAGDRKLYPHFS